MSHAGPPSEPPDPNHDANQDPKQGPNRGEGEGGVAPGEQPYSPYPSNWPPSGQQSPYDQASPYGPGSPYGQQSPYGAPGQQPANPYAGPASTRPTFGFGGYAGWFTRVGAYLIDAILGALAALPLWVGYVVLFSDATTTTDANGVKHLHVHPTGTTTALVWLGILTSLGFQIWNVYIRQGRTGASYGKSVLAIRLVNSDLQPIGPGWAFVRQLLHIVDSLPCGIGWLWPIWDSRKQTFADKIMHTFVIQATAPAPPPY